MSAKSAQQIRRKSHVSDSVRTEQKDAAAEYIEAEIIDKGLWPMQMTQIAEKSKKDLGDEGWSRQHISNTLEDYFEPAGTTASQETADGEDSATPADFESVREAYRQGYRDGFEDGVETAKRL